MRQSRRGTHHFLWDSALIETVDDALFQPQRWAVDDALAGQAGGRGTAHFLQASASEQWVLRHGMRGGAVARLSRDAYVWLGAARCRTFREWRLLHDLYRRGLPVPRPVAARAVRAGALYRCDLITVRVAAARPLAEHLREQALGEVSWRAIGATIARFHIAGVYHHDLNARNILLDEQGGVTLIDFDKSRLRTPGRWCARNLARLRRSLDKIHAAGPGLHYDAADWSVLQAGYASRSGAA